MWGTQTPRHRQRAWHSHHPLETMPIHPDSDAHKGAVEDDKRSDNSLGGQIGHRDENEMLKDADSDFPEPGSNPEHSGEHK